MYRLSTLSRVTKQTLLPTTASSYLRPTLTSSFVQARRHYASSSPPSVNDGFLHGNAANYIEEMYEAWLKDPSSVHLSWQVYFKNMANGVPSGDAYTPPPTIMPSDSARLPELPAGVATMGESSKKVIEHMKIQLLVRAYQVRGHHLANLDPLHIEHASTENQHPPELTYQYYGFTDKDLDRKFTLGPGILPAMGKTSKELSLREIIEALRKMYCKCGVPWCRWPKS